MARKPTNAVGVLNELLGVEADGERSAEGVLKLCDPALIEIRPQARTLFDEAEMADLRESIAETRKKGLGIERTGLLQPLNAFRLASGKLVLIAGERRLRAALTLKLPEVPVVVSDVAESDDVQILQLIENLQRAPLWPLEEARGLALLRTTRGLSIRDLAKAVGKGKGYVEHRLALLDAPGDVQNMASARPDTIAVAREVSRVTDDEARKKLIDAVLKGASKREIENRVAEILAPAPVPDVSPVRQTGGNADDGDFKQNDADLASRSHESRATKAGVRGVGTSAPASSGVGFSTASGQGQNLKPAPLRRDQSQVETEDISSLTLEEARAKLNECARTIGELGDRFPDLKLNPEQYDEIQPEAAQLWSAAHLFYDKFTGIREGRVYLKPPFHKNDEEL